MKDALTSKFRAVFSRDPEIVARALGRIEFIGNHTDYNGGTVLGAAIDRSAWVGLARRPDDTWVFASDSRPDTLQLPSGPIERVVGGDSWVNYPLGVLSVVRDSGLAIPGGFDYAVVSDVPSGAGLSSSAAIELASCLAFLGAAGESVSRETLAALGRRAENEFVGVPCGILDQGVSAFGLRDHLVHIDCRGPRYETVPIPAGSNFWVFNTHTKHALIDGLYAARHEECMEAARVLGVPLLADASASMLAAAKHRLAPACFMRAQHVINEIARVEQSVLALRSGDLAAVGRLLIDSHHSSRDLFENSCAELDFLVDGLEQEVGVYGARLTGGGFGGAAMALTSDAFGDAAVTRISTAYLARFGVRPEVLRARTEDGAAVVKKGP